MGQSLCGRVLGDQHTSTAVSPQSTFNINFTLAYAYCLPYNKLLPTTKICILIPDSDWWTARSSYKCLTALLVMATGEYSLITAFASSSSSFQFQFQLWSHEQSDTGDWHYRIQGICKRIKVIFSQQVMFCRTGKWCSPLAHIGVISLSIIDRW